MYLTISEVYIYIYIYLFIYLFIYVYTQQNSTIVSNYNLWDCEIPYCVRIKVLVIL